MPTERPGAKHLVRLEDLPRRPPTKENRHFLVPKLVKRSATPGFLKVPDGYEISLFAEGLTNPRNLTVAPNGDVFVVESRLEMAGPRLAPDRVTLLRDADGDGVADLRSVFARNLYLPYGIGIHAGFLYVANTNEILRWPYRSGQLVAESPPETVLSGIPERGYNQHWTRNILFDPAGKTLYLTISSAENVAVEDSRRGTICAFRLGPDGGPFGQGKIVASGLRNAIGLAFDPHLRRLWTTVNERDYSGDALVPDFFTRVRTGGFYGWPYFYLGKNVDRRVPARPDLASRSLVPDLLLEAHSAPLGCTFWRGDAYVALHGSANRIPRVGNTVVRIPFGPDGLPTGGYEDFIVGWVPDPSSAPVYGRPAALAVDRAGALLIADDAGGRIWRVTARSGR